MDTTPSSIRGPGVAHPLHPGEARFDLAADAAGLGSWELDLATRTLTASDRCKANHGLPPGADLQLDRDVVGSIDEDARDGFVEQLDHALGGRDVFEAEVPNTWPDGSHHWLLIRGRVLDDTRMIGVTMDVTERRRMEERLRDIDRRKDEFLAILGHELRNPLAAVIAAAKFLEATGPPDPKLQRARETIVRQAAQITRIVNDLMDVGRINSNKLRLDRREVSLRAVVAAAVETCAPEISRRGQTLDVTLSEGDVVIDADITRLVQALCNLLTNASKYMDEGGVVTLSGERQGSEAVIRVSDRGIGIAPEMLGVIFERFVQVRSARDASEGGLGLGLSLVKAIVEMHDGRVEARSAGIGRGSEFVIWLPAASKD